MTQYKEIVKVVQEKFKGVYDKDIINDICRHPFEFIKEVVEDHRDMMPIKLPHLGRFKLMTPYEICGYKTVLDDNKYLSETGSRLWVSRGGKDSTKANHLPDLLYDPQAVKLFQEIFKNDYGWIVSEDIIKNHKYYQFDNFESYLNKVKIVDIKTEGYNIPFDTVWISYSDICDILRHMSDNFRLTDKEIKPKYTVEERKGFYKK